MAESWRSALRSPCGRLQDQSLSGKSERQKTHPVRRQATNLSLQVPGSEQLSAGRWRCRLGTNVSALHHHHHLLQLWSCLHCQCSAERGLCAPVSQPSPPCAQSHPVWRHRCELLESAGFTMRPQWYLEKTFFKLNFVLKFVFYSMQLFYKATFLALEISFFRSFLPVVAAPEATWSSDAPGCCSFSPSDVSPPETL